MKTLYAAITWMRPSAMFVVLACILSPSLLYAQDSGADKSPISGRPPVSPMSLYDEDGIPLGHYVYVDQLNERFLLELKCGELELRTAKNDTLGVMWDHPLMRNMITPYLPVYEYNGLKFQNEVISLPFTPVEGDTLFYFRVYGVDFPTLDRDKHFLEYPDVDGVVVEDSLTFLLEVIDVESGATLATLDQILITPAKSFEELVEQLAARGVDEHRDFLSTGWWVPEPDMLNRAMRVRITPIHHPQREGNFERRALYCKFRWEDRASLGMKERDSWMTKEVLRILDSTNALRKAALASQSQVFDIDIRPATLSGGVENVEVAFPMQVPEGGVFALVNSAGATVLEMPLHADRAVDRIALRIDTGTMPAGSYFAVVRMNGKTGTRLVRLVK